jgi:hypothetical protein
VINALLAFNTFLLITTVKSLKEMTPLVNPIKLFFFVADANNIKPCKPGGLGPMFNTFMSII